MDELPEVRLCEVSNEARGRHGGEPSEEEGIPARSDANQRDERVWRLPFEPGHAGLSSPASLAAKGRIILSHYPHFKNLKTSTSPSLETTRPRRSCPPRWNGR